MVVINVKARMYNERIPRYQGDIEVVDVECLSKLSGGVVDVELFLVSRNTLGNGKTANSKSQRPNVKWW